MNKFGWFLTGIYTLAIIICFYLSYKNIGDIENRIFIFVYSIIAIGFNIIFLKDKKEVIQMEKEKKQKKTREPNEWTKCVAKVRAENKGMKASEIFKKAKEVYKK